MVNSVNMHQIWMSCRSTLESSLKISPPTKTDPCSSKWTGLLYYVNIFISPKFYDLRCSRIHFSNNFYTMKGYEYLPNYMHLTGQSCQVEQSYTHTHTHTQAYHIYHYHVSIEALTFVRFERVCVRWSAFVAIYRFEFLSHLNHGRRARQPTVKRHSIWFGG